MAAPVRLESEFFDDPSIDALATILGYEDRDTAAGKLARLFSWQTEKYTAERPTYAVPRSTLIGIFGARGPEAMVEAGLATLQADGLYKIHGSDKPNGRTPGKTRVNWLWLERQAQAERGRKRAASAGDGARDQGRFTSAAPAGDQPATIRKHAGNQPPASSLISDLRTPDPETHTPRAREGQPELVTDATVGCDQDVPGKPDERGRSVDRVLVLAERFRSEVDTARRALLVELGAPFPPSRTTDAAVLSMAMSVVAGWCASEPDQDPEAIVAARSAHLLANRLAVARDRRRADWWAPSTFWDPDGIGKDLEHRTPADAVAASRARAGPRDGQPRRPASPTRGQAPAIVSPHRPDGEIPL